MLNLRSDQTHGQIWSWSLKLSISTWHPFVCDIDSPRSKWCYCDCSGVTRVGVTRGGNHGVAPIFTWKTDDFFKSSPSAKWAMTFLAVRSRLSTVLSTFSHSFFISFGCHPWKVSPRAVPPPPSDATHWATASLRRVFQCLKLNKYSESKNRCWCLPIIMLILFVLWLFSKTLVNTVLGKRRCRLLLKLQASELLSKVL